jgi:hypothetical protein
MDLKPKAWHEQHLASADREKIVQHLEDGQNQDVTRIAVTLARQCDLYVHFERLWIMRVADLDESLRTEKFMKRVYVNKRALYKELISAARS